MKAPFVISVVAGLHIVAIAGLIFMPGCRSTLAPVTGPELSGRTTLPPRGERDKVSLPTPTTPSRSAGTPARPWPTETKTYSVKKGDVLSRIGSRFGVEVSEIMRLNGMTNAHKLYVGQKLVLPGSDSCSIAAQTKET